MKKTYLLLVTAVALFAFTNISFGQTSAPNLGTTVNFALFTKVGAITAAASSTLTGDAGTNGGAVNGFEPPPTGATINGFIRYPSSPESMSAATDVLNLYNSLLAAPCNTTATIGNVLGGLTLVSSSTPGSPSGVFCQTSATPASLNGTLTLSGNGIFIIKLSNTLTTGTSSSIVLTNGAEAKNVFFQVTGAAALGAGSIFRGTIVASGAIAVGAGGSVSGRLLSTAGAISIAEILLTKTDAPSISVVPVITNLAASPSTVCAGSPITFTATVTNVPLPYAFTITNGSNTVSGNESSASFTRVLTASGSGPQVFSLIVSNVGSVTSATTSVSVNALSVVVDGPIGCGRTSALITAQATGATSYSLLGPGGSQQVNNSGVFSVTVGGSYTVLADLPGACILSNTVIVVDGGGVQPSASNFRASGSLGAGSCRVRLLATATGNNFVMTGPNGYVFSTVYRCEGTYEVYGNDVLLPGTYTLTVYSGSSSRIYTTVVNGTACLSGQ